MEETVFFIESKTKLNDDDFFILRNLYLPIIGCKSVILFEYMNDLSRNYYMTIFNVKDVENHIQVNKGEFNELIDKLQAVGLVNKFVKSNNNNQFIFELNKPLILEKFNKNSLLKNNLINKIGINNYEKIYFEQNKKHISKSDYIDVTLKYQDVFDLNIEEEQINQYSTLDLVVKTFDKHEENIEKLPATHFIKYMIKRNPTFSESQLINYLLKSGFADCSINLLIDFSMKHNDGKIIVNYIKTIASDFRSRSIVSFNEIQHELMLANEIKSSFYKKSNKLNNILVEKNDNFVATTKELSLNDFLSDEDIEEIF